MPAEYMEPKEGKLSRWEDRLQELLRLEGREESDLAVRGRADRMPQEQGASLVWLAERLQIPRPATLRTGLWRIRHNVDT